MQFKMPHKILKVRIWMLIILVIITTIGASFSILSYYKSQYKTKYSEYVIKYADQNNVDPLFIYSIIKTESDFNPNAISNVSARGLMQIMEPTFNWLRSKNPQLNKFSYSDMFDPEININCGVCLFKLLLDEFKEYETAIAAYHAGRGAVNSWLLDAMYSDDKINLKKIPSKETAHYVDKVMNTFKIYKKMYG